MTTSELTITSSSCANTLSSWCSQQQGIGSKKKCSLIEVVGNSSCVRAALSAQDYEYVGRTLKAKGRYQKALVKFRNALAIRVLEEEEEEGINTPTDTAATYQAIAELLYIVGQYDESLIQGCRAASIFHKVLGEYHPITVQCRTHITLAASAIQGLANITTAALEDDKGTNEICQLFINMQQLYDTTSNRRGRKPSHLTNEELIQHYRKQKKQAEQQLNNDAFTFIHSFVFDLHHSKVKDFLNSLSPIYVQDLLLETCHKGSYLLLRTVEEPYRMDAIFSAVEDTQGSIALVSFANFSRTLADSPIACLPRNTIFVIKEPYFQFTPWGVPMIRCESPSDVVPLQHFQDENYKRLLNTISSIRKNDWEKALCESCDCVYASPRPQSPMDWKSRGNDLYKRRFIKDAVRAYTIGLSICSKEESEDTKLGNLLMLNRSAAFLTMGKFENAAKDALCVLQSMPGNIKALSRAARSFYNLRSFPLALLYFEELVVLDPSSQADLALCRQRVQEESTGQYDWDSLRDIVESSPTKALRLDVADYFNSDAIEVRYISKEKGRGVFAKRDIPPGTLLLVCKAFAVSFASEIKKKVITQIHFKENKAHDSTMVQLATSVIHKILDCPSLGEEFYQLWSGREEDDDSSVNDVIDCERIYQINRLNSFSTCETAEGIKMAKNYPGSPRPSLSSLEDSLSNKEGVGLWIMSSYFNHSCVPNTTEGEHLGFVGDVMVKVSSCFIKAGEEVTIAYVPPVVNPEERQQRFQQYGFTCKCALCKIEDGLDEKSLADLHNKFIDEVTPSIHKFGLNAIPILKTHVAEIKKVYAKHGQSKFMFHLIDPLCVLALLYKMQKRIKESMDTYEKAFVYYSNITNVDAYVNNDERLNDEPMYYSPTLQLVVEQLVLGYRDLGELHQAEKWARLVILYESFGGLDPVAARKKHFELFQGLHVQPTPRALSKRKTWML